MGGGFDFFSFFFFFLVTNCIFFLLEMMVEVCLEYIYIYIYISLVGWMLGLFFLSSGYGW